jgi:hypothetical protein
MDVPCGLFFGGSFMISFVLMSALSSSFFAPEAGSIATQPVSAYVDDAKQVDGKPQDKTQGDKGQDGKTQDGKGQDGKPQDGKGQDGSKAPLKVAPVAPVVPGADMKNPAPKKVG